MASLDVEVTESLLHKVKAYVQDFISNYDPSHDWNHILRVVQLAHDIQAKTPGTDRSIVTLCSLLHDVGDKKYLKPGEDASRQIRNVLVSFGASESLADKAQTICLGVSFSSEIKNPARVRDLIAQHPELAVVQDADRLDAIGAVGVGRAFAFGASRNRPLGDSVQHFEDKLIKLEGMMKTEEGKRLAKERTERIRLVMEWWKEETANVPVDLMT